jgi:gliding motility-associated-like protein
MLKAFLTSLFLFLFLEVFSQTFYRTYGNTSTNESGLCTIKSPDGNFFIGGYKDDSAMIVKLDPLGNILWTKCVKPTVGNNIIHDISISPDGFLIGVGNGFNSLTSVPRDGFVFKMDLAGTSLWLSIVNDNRDIFFDNIIPVSSTNYIIYGSVYETSSFSWPDVISVNVDASNGSIISTSPRYDYVPSNSFIDDCYSSTMNSSGTAIYSTGRIYVNGSSPSSMRPFISRFGTNGQHQWSKYLLFNSSQSARIYGIDIIFENNSLTIAYFGDVNGASSNFTVGLIHTDTLGNVLWSKNYNLLATNAEISSNLLVTPNGYVITGYELSGGNDLFMLSTDFQGNMLWTKSYGTPASTENLRYTHLACSYVDAGLIYFTAQSVQGINTDMLFMCTDLSGNIQCINPSNLTLTTTINPTISLNTTVSPVQDSLSYLYPNTQSSLQILNDNCSSINVNLGADTSLCNGSITLNATTSGNAQYLWQNGSTNSTLQVTQPGQYWVQVIVNCCMVSDTINITGGNTPLAAFDFTFDTCSSEYSFFNNSVNATNYLWDFGDGNTATSISPVNTYNSTNTYTITLTASNSCGSDSVQQIIQANGYSINALFSSSSILLSNNQTQFTFTDQSSGNISGWLWDFGDNNYSTQASPQHTYQQPGTYTVTLVVTNEAGCSDSISTLIIIESEVSFYVPNAFTPNGDGLNDTFNGVGVGIVNYKMLIFDRWGELIFETHSLANSWDGTYKGKIVQQDVYTYKIELTDNKSNQRSFYGRITVIR